MTSTGYLNSFDWLNILIAKLDLRYSRERRMHDLDYMVMAAHTLLSITPPGHQSRAAALSTLGDKHAMRFEQTGAMADLNRAVEASKEALETTPLGHQLRFARLDR